VSDIVLERLSLLYLPSDRPTASLLPVTQSIVVQLASATSSLSNGVSDRTGAHQLKLNVLVPHRFSRLTEERLVTPFGPVAQNSPNHSWVGHRIEGNRPVQLYCGQYTEFWYSRLIEAVKVELPRSALLPGGPGEWSTHIVPCPERHPLDLHSRTTLYTQHQLAPHALAALAGRRVVGPRPCWRRRRVDGPDLDASFRGARPLLA
jgi:hypothetical protein